MYKGNRMLVLVPLFDRLYPNAKWVFIERDIRETYRSRFGEDLSFEDWQALHERRMDYWRAAAPSDRALYIDYHDFKTDADVTIRRIAEHIGVQLDDRRLRTCREFFRPRR